MYCGTEMTPSARFDRAHHSMLEDHGRRLHGRDPNWPELSHRLSASITPVASTSPAAAIAHAPITNAVCDCA